MPERPSSLLADLHRRKVFRAAVGYAIVALAVIEGADIVFGNLQFPGWAIRLVIVLALLGFPITLVLSWWFDLTPDGIRRSEASHTHPAVRLGLIAAVLGLTGLAGWFSWVRWLDPNATAPPAGSATLATGAPPLTRVAVLYFDDHSPDGDLGYLAAGLTEELIHQLSQVEALDVVSRNGVKLFRDQAVPLDSIAAVLGAGTFVEGSVQRSGDQLRVTVQLIDGASGSHLSSRTLEQSWGELFELQEDVAETVGMGLRERLGEAVQLQTRRGTTTSVEAWEEYQRALRVKERMVAAAQQTDTVRADRLLQEADSLFERAQELDRDWPEPLVERGWLHAETVVDTDGEYVIRSRDYLGDRTATALLLANSALDLAPNHAGALELRGFIYMVRWSHGMEPTAATRDRARENLQAAVDREPGRARAWRLLSNLAMKSGNFEAGLYDAERALEADAFLEDAVDIYGLLYETNLNLERVEEAKRWCDEGRRRFPRSTLMAVCGLFTLASIDGDASTIPAVWERLAEYTGQTGEQAGWNRAVGLSLVAATLARAEMPDSARAVLQRARDALPPEDANAAFFQYYDAYVTTLLGDTDRALDLVDALLQAYPSQRDFLQNDWWFRPLWQEPRFQALTDTPS